MHFSLHRILPVLALALLLPQLIQAQPSGPLQDVKFKHKDDVVILDNGDRLTGEIKSVSGGILYFKSDRAVGTLQLDWKTVRYFQSKARFEFETREGLLYIGYPDPSDKISSPDGEIHLRMEDNTTIQLKTSDIITVRELQRSFWARFNLSLDAGITYTQANNQTQTNVQASLLFTNPRYTFTGNFNSLFTTQTDAIDTSRQELVFTGNRYISKPWETIALVYFLSDNEQQIDLRTTLGGGIRRMFVKGNRTRFSAVAGLAYTKETYFDPVDNRSSLEVLTGMQYSSYQFRGSEINAYVLIYPSITESGRIRVDSNAYWKWELVSDLYWKVSTFNNYDNQPPQNTPSNNFGVTSSIGWSF